MLSRIYFTGNGDWQNLLAFSSMPSLLTLENNKKINWISTVLVLSCKTLKPFDSKFEPTMPNLVNGRIIIKYNNYVLVQKDSSSLYSNFILNLYIFCELNSWLRNPTNLLPLKDSLFGTVKLVRNGIKRRFTC